MHELINGLIMNNLKNGILERMDDSDIMENMHAGRIAMTTDSYVVNPMFFRGGDIGRLCISGTVNDLATSGAIPYALSLSFILEEGMDIGELERIVKSIASTATEAGVRIVTGDTKVVEKGKGDGLYINTCGIGHIPDGVDISTYNAKENDDVIITGYMGNHEVAMVKARELIDFDIDVESDVAPLNKKIEALLKKNVDIHCIKDPTRGGVASALFEIAEHSKCETTIQEDALPVHPGVRSVCEIVGYDPLYLANEGKYIIICPSGSTKDVLLEFGKDAKVIGKVGKTGEARLLYETAYGGIRRMGMLETTQLPRIC